MAVGSRRGTTAGSVLLERPVWSNLTRSGESAGGQDECAQADRPLVWGAWAQQNLLEQLSLLEVLFMLLFEVQPADAAMVQAMLSVFEVRAWARCRRTP